MKVGRKRDKNKKRKGSPVPDLFPSFLFFGQSDSIHRQHFIPREKRLRILRPRCGVGSSARDAGLMPAASIFAKMK
jgi:hypothetical protein